MNIVCATTNAGKVAEMEQMLPPGVHLLPRPKDVGDVEESADTLVGNARLKAHAIVRATGMAALADDTGLEVHALGGLPGVRTARFAGPNATDAENRTKMLEVLRDASNRTARFVTVVVLAWPNADGEPGEEIAEEIAEEIIVEGVCEGTIAMNEVGERGFGFDPLFIPDDGDGRTFAQMDASEKNAISHRGRAFQALARELTNREGR